LHIPPVVDDSDVPHFAFGPDTGLHIWPRDDFMLIALPNDNKSYTATLFAPYNGANGFNALHTVDDRTLLTYMSSNFPDAVAHMPDVVKQFHASPVGSLMTTHVSPWHQGRIVLMGDAAHAVLPFLGQGMNAAFEDAYMLFRRLQTCRGDVLKAAADFSEERRSACDSLAEMSHDHYMDMAKNTTSFTYHLNKRLENVLRSFAPKLFVPLYAMIAFTDIPYDVARERAQTQKTVLRWAGRALGALLTFGCMKLLGSGSDGVPLYCQIFKCLKGWTHPSR
jgi:kynurenine 3-monooxygenase